MATYTGTHDIRLLLQTRFAGAKAIGEMTIREVLELDLALHSQLASEMFTELVRDTTSARDITGGSAAIRGEIVDEYGAAETKISEVGSEVGFPLEKLQYPTGFTEMWLANAMPEDLLIRQESVQIGNLQDMQMLIKKAVYNSANRTVRDINVDRVSVGVKAFYNSDGADIPNSPNSGEVFDPSNHDHYHAAVSIDDAAVRALITDVTHHGASPRPRIYMAASSMSDFKANVTDFNENQYAYMDIQASDVPLNRRPVEDVSDFHWGWLDNCEIWIKPYAIPNYYFCFDINQPRSLARRSHTTGYLSGLTLATPINANPLRAEHYEQLIGFGVAERANGAVLYVGGGSYVDPVIT